MFKIIEYLFVSGFTCALQKEILYQGKLFLSENWICFHSKVFGKDTKVSKIFVYRTVMLFLTICSLPEVQIIVQG